jgi:hypothetical protein
MVHIHTGNHHLTVCVVHSNAVREAARNLYGVWDCDDSRVFQHLKTHKREGMCGSRQRKKAASQELEGTYFVLSIPAL